MLTLAVCGLLQSSLLIQKSLYMYYKSKIYLLVVKLLIAPIDK